MFGFTKSVLSAFNKAIGVVIVILLLPLLGCGMSETKKVKTVPTERTSTKKKTAPAKSLNKPVSPEAPKLSEPHETSQQPKTAQATKSNSEESVAASDEESSEALHPSCAALVTDPAVHREWLRKSVSRIKAKKSDRDLSYLEDLDQWLKNEKWKDTTEFSFPIWSDDSPTFRIHYWPNRGIKDSYPKKRSSTGPMQGTKGCWDIVPTGVADIGEDKCDGQLVYVVDYTYAIAFADQTGRVSIIDISTFHEGVDFYNSLTLQDVNGDGWEEAFYSAGNGWTGADHDPIEGVASISLTSQKGTLQKIHPLDQGNTMPVLYFEDENEDGYIDAKYCYDSPNFGASLCTLFVPDESGQLTLNHPISHALLQEQCDDYKRMIHSVRQVLCARIFGECTSSIKKRIKENNAKWSYKREKRGKEQLSNFATPLYTSMMEAASYTPKYPAFPLCDK